MEVFCGTDTTGLLVSWAKVPHDKSSTSTESNRRLVPGTYSSEPPLTSLTVSSGTLSPTFHSHTFTYTAPDLTNAENRVTITTTAKPGYSITFIKFVTAYSGELHCPWASGVCTVTWRDSSNNVVDFLTDADPDTDGFQIDLDVGETKIVMDVYEGGIGTGNSRGYGVTVTRAPNTPATGAPTISGTVQVGETLTADTSSIADEDGLDDATFSYQWIANDGTSDADISGATGATYALTDAEEGNAIKVKVSFTDDAGNEESLTSAATAAVVAAANTAATGALTISGTAQVGETLTAETSGIADPDGLTNVSYGYQWLSSRDTEIDGATSSTYTIPASDEGKVITVRVSFTDDAGNEESLTSAATAAVAAAALTPLTASIHSEPASHDGQAEFTFELRFSENLEGFSYSTLQNHAFTVNAGEVVKARRLESGKNIRWEITINPASSADVTIVLPITTDCSANGAVCTGDGRKLSNRLALTVSGPTDQENSAATGSPTISGTVQVGQTLTSLTTGIADTDGLTNASYSYQWVRNNGTSDSDIADATASTYALVDEDAGKTIKVQVTFTDDAGHEEILTSAATAAVEARPNSPATGEPTISGTVQVGETLTASTSGIADTDGLTNVSYSYQWIRNDGSTDTDIQDATGSGYSLVDEDAGKTIKVQVTFTDDAGHEETLTSTPTASVEARPNSPAMGAPTISGTVQVGETLTASTSGIADTDGLTNVSYSYQWIRNDGSTDTDIQDATGSGYSLVDEDEGKTIKVQVTFTDDAGNAETLTSAASASVAGVPEPITVILENNPASHNGTDEFTFQIRFSEHFKLSYKTLRDHAFTVVGGTVKKAQRQVKGSNIGWTITVEPASNAEVEIVLPATTDCGATGAICTADGRKLSNSLDFTVVGPGE